MKEQNANPSLCSNSSPLTRRRLLQSGVGVANASTVGLAGCIGRDPEDFEECRATVVAIEWLPDPAKDEVETALEDGRYETDDKLFLPHLINIDSSYLSTESNPIDMGRREKLDAGDQYCYEAFVEQDGSITTLELKEAIPSNGEEPLEIQTDTDESFAAEIHLERLYTGETIFEKSIVIGPDESIETVAYDRQFGGYEVTVRTEQGSSTARWGERNDKARKRILYIRPDGLVNPRPEPYTHPESCEEMWSGYW